MKAPIVQLTLLAFGLAGGGLPVADSPEDSAMPPPRLPKLFGVTVAGAGGSQKKEDKVERFEKLAGKSIGSVVLNDYLASDSWSSLSGGYVSTAFCGIHSINPNRQMMVSVQLTLNGTPLSDVANGLHDNDFRQVAQTLASCQPNALIRIGWEQNGNWEPWFSGNGNDGNYINAFRRVVRIFKSVGSGWTFVWCPNWGETNDPPPNSYPGDDVVDIVAMDVYDFGGDFDSNYLNGSYGLNWLASFGAQHHKPLGIGEWGAGQFGDNPAFITGVCKFIKGSNTKFQAYWETRNAYDAFLPDYPQEKSAFKRCFQNWP